MSLHNASQSTLSYLNLEITNTPQARKRFLSSHNFTSRLEHNPEDINPGFNDRKCARFGHKIQLVTQLLLKVRSSKGNLRDNLTILVHVVWPTFVLGQKDNNSVKRAAAPEFPILLIKNTHFTIRPNSSPGILMMSGPNIDPRVKSPTRFPPWFPSVDLLEVASR